MTEYLGPLGRLMGLRCPSTETTDRANRYSTRTTVEGRRRAQLTPASPRTWSIEWDVAYRPEMAMLRSFTDGEWGPGPWHWVPVTAHRGNLLTPAEAACQVASDQLVPGGPVRVADGAWAGSSYLTSGVTTYARVASDVPVIPGMPVSWSVDVRGDGTTPPQLAMTFNDAGGAQLSAWYFSGAAKPGMQRVTQTRVVPEGAASMNVGVRATALQVARPQVTWTDGPVPFTAGAGCRSAVIEAGPEELIAMWDGIDYRATRFTVMEVG